MLCKRLDVTWAELRSMPETVLEVWEALINGEQRAQAEKKA